MATSFCSPNGYAFPTLTRPSCEYRALCLLCIGTSAGYLSRSCNASPGYCRCGGESFLQPSISYRCCMHVLDAPSSVIALGPYSRMNSHDGIVHRSWANHFFRLVITTGDIQIWLFGPSCCRTPGRTGRRVRKSTRAWGSTCGLGNDTLFTQPISSCRLQRLLHRVSISQTAGMASFTSGMPHTIAKVHSLSAVTSANICTC